MKFRKSLQKLRKSKFGSKWKLCSETVEPKLAKGRQTLVLFKETRRPKSLQDDPDSWVYYPDDFLAPRDSGVQFLESISQVMTYLNL